MAFAQIYICPKHGEVINTHIHEAIDHEYDEVYHITMCGEPIFRPLTDEEIQWESLGFSFGSSL